MDDSAPESWEVADLEASVSRLLLSAKKDTSSPSSLGEREFSESSAGFGSIPENNQVGMGGSGSGNGSSISGVASSVDQFLIEAIQNPRERVSVLRIEQDIEKFVRDPIQQQMEFKQLPTSYLRLAAHRVAQHYSLQSMVLLDNNLPDGSASKIIIRKTSDSRIPSIRLVDIPVNLPCESKGVAKVAIKQRPQKNSTNAGSANSNANKANSAKSVEERKEEYNRARARIFSSNSFNGGNGERLENEPRALDNFRSNSLGRVKFDDKTAIVGPDVNVSRASGDSSSSSRIGASRVEKEPVSRSRTNNKVAIIRDRDVERSDPDYDRSYDRYMQRFDPGFGFSGGNYAVQPMYAPAVNYNTEFPQLGPAPRLLIPAEHQHHGHPQHLPPGSWVSPSTPPGMGYAHPDAMIAAYRANHVPGQPPSALYMHSQYHTQHPGMPIYPHDQIQSFTQAHRQQHDASFGFARPR